MKLIHLVKNHEGKLLYKVASSWRTIAILIGLDYQIESIENNEHND